MRERLRAVRDDLASMGLHLDDELAKRADREAGARRVARLSIGATLAATAALVMCAAIGPATHKGPLASVWERLDALEMLEAEADANAVPVLVAALDDENVLVRQAAAVYLTHRNQRVPDRIVGEVLGDHEPDAIEVVGEIAADEAEEWRRRILESLLIALRAKALVGEAHPFLIQVRSLTAHESPEVRKKAVECLASDSRFQPSPAMLRRLRSDPDSRVRQAAARWK